MFSRRQKKELPLPAIDDQIRINNKHEVIETIDSLGISRERLIVVGSSVLTLLDLERHAHDVDIILHPEELATILRNATLPNGIATHEQSFSRPELPYLAAKTQPLPSELFSHRTSLSRLTFDEFVRHSAARTSDGFLVVHPQELLRVKRKPTRIGPDRARKLAQDAYDVEQLERLVDSTLGGRINGRLFRP